MKTHKKSNRHTLAAHHKPFTKAAVSRLAAEKLKKLNKLDARANAMIRDDKSKQIAEKLFQEHQALNAKIPNLMSKVRAVPLKPEGVHQYAGKAHFIITADDVFFVDAGQIVVFTDEALDAASVLMAVLKGNRDN